MPSVIRKRRVRKASRTVDLQAEHHGSVYLFRATSDAVLRRLMDAVPPDCGARYWGHALVVRPAYADACGEGLRDEGFTIG